MIYTRALTLPAKTNGRVITSIEQMVVPGIVKQLWLTFPAGCAGLVGVRLKYQESVILPTNIDEWFVADNITFDFVQNLELDDAPYRFYFEGYNDDCVYQHTIYFRLSIIKPEPMSVRDLMAQLVPTRQTVSGPN